MHACMQPCLWINTWNWWTTCIVHACFCWKGSSKIRIASRRSLNLVPAETMLYISLDHKPLHIGFYLRKWPLLAMSLTDNDELPPAQGPNLLLHWLDSCRDRLAEGWGWERTYLWSPLGAPKQKKLKSPSSGKVREVRLFETLHCMLPDNLERAWSAMMLSSLFCFPIKQN